MKTIKLFILIFIFFGFTKLAKSDVIEITMSESVNGVGYQKTNFDDIFMLISSQEPGVTFYEWLDQDNNVLGTTSSYNIAIDVDYYGWITFNQVSTNPDYTYSASFYLYEPSNYDVTFSVFGDGTPLEGANVNLEGVGDMLTGADGICVFANVLQGTYNYTVTADGFYSTSGGFPVINTNVNTTLNLQHNFSEINKIDDSFSLSSNIIKNFLVIEVSEPFNWQIYSLSGRLVSSGNNKKVNMTSFKSGFYLIYIKTSNNEFVSKVFKL